MSNIVIPKTEAGQFLKTMKEFNLEANPKCLKENFFYLGSIALLTTNNIIMILIANRITDSLYPMLTMGIAFEYSVTTFYDQLRLLK